MKSVIQLRDVVKTFGKVRALDGLDLDVRPGEVHGFLGPNGAGKSTTIRVILGLIKADSGSIKLFEGDPWNEASTLHRRLAYVPGDVNLWPSLTGGQIIDLLGRLHGSFDVSRRDELIEKFELDPSKKARTYSKGNRQKVSIIAALAAQSELLILDEPTAGLDPLMEALFREEIRVERAAGRSVLLSSHILSEVQALADHISIIRNGRIVDSGTLDTMRSHALTSVRVSVDSGSVSAAVAAAQACPGVGQAVAHGPVITVSTEPDQLPIVLETLFAFKPSSVEVSPPSLEDLFLKHYGSDAA